MAFNRKDLGGNVGPGASAPTLFTYKTLDAQADITGAGYFNEGADILNTHDVLICATSSGLVIGHVSANDGEVVTFVAYLTEA